MQPSQSDQPATTGVPAAITMRKLIRSKATGEYLTEQGTWTRELQNARNFVEHSEAQAASRHLGSQAVELYYSFSSDQATDYDFTSSVL